MQRYKKQIKKYLKIDLEEQKDVVYLHAVKKRKL